MQPTKSNCYLAHGPTKQVRVPLIDPAVVLTVLRSAMRIVFAGNPGVGKSSLLNSLIGEVRFASGISIGTGLTTATQIFSYKGVEYVDTPGLDDVQTRQRAAAELSRALSGGGLLKIVFVCTLEAGTVKSADLATIDAVLKAVEAHGVNLSSKFFVIVNKCDSGEMRQLGDPCNKQRVVDAFAMKRGKPIVTFLPMNRDANGARNALIGNRNGLWNFISSADGVEVPPGADVQVTVEDYEFEERKLQEQIHFMRTQLAQEEARKRLSETVKKWVKIAVGVGVGVALVSTFVFLRRRASSSLFPRRDGRYLRSAGNFTQRNVTQGNFTQGNFTRGNR